MYTIQLYTDQELDIICGALHLRYQSLIDRASREKDESPRDRMFRNDANRTWELKESIELQLDIRKTAS